MDTLMWHGVQAGLQASPYGQARGSAGPAAATPCELCLIKASAWCKGTSLRPASDPEQQLPHLSNCTFRQPGDTP